MNSVELSASVQNTFQFRMAAFSQGLFLVVVRLYEVFRVDMTVNFLSAVLGQLRATEFRGAPHFVGVEFIRAPELVIVFVFACAVCQRVSSLKTEFFVEIEEGLVAHRRGCS